MRNLEQIGKDIENARKSLAAAVRDGPDFPTTADFRKFADAVLDTLGHLLRVVEGLRG